MADYTQYYKYMPYCMTQPDLVINEEVNSYCIKNASGYQEEFGNIRH